MLYKISPTIYADNGAKVEGLIIKEQPEMPMQVLFYIMEL